jgi:hypothetical protein
MNYFIRTAVGDRVEEDEVIGEIETDKVEERPFVDLHKKVENTFSTLFLCLCAYRQPCRSAVQLQV